MVRCLWPALIIAAVFSSTRPNRPAQGPVLGTRSPHFDITFARPAKTPNVGTTIGAGSVAIDALAGLPVHRLTDILSAWPRASSCWKIRDCTEFQIGAGGSAEKNVISWDDRRVMLSDTGGDGLPYVFDPDRMSLTPIPPDGTTSKTALPQGCQFSEAHNYDCYAIGYKGGAGSGHPLLISYDLSSPTEVPKPRVVYDIGADPNCYPSGYPINKTNSVPFDVSDDESLFVLAPGPNGQGSARIVIAIQPGLGQGRGCRYYATDTRTMGGSWGTNGASSDTDSYTVHNLALAHGPNPNYVRIDYEKCLAVTATCPASADGDVLWQINSVTATGVATGGHEVMGQISNIDNRADCDPTCQMFSQQMFTNFSTFTHITNTKYLPPNHTGWDFHISWANANSTDTTPWAGTTFVTNPGVQTAAGVLNYAWDGEVIQGLMDGSGAIARYAHTHCVYDTTDSFNAYDCIGTVSPDGKYLFWTSAWDNTLGGRAQQISSWSRAENVVTVTNSAAVPFAVNDSVLVSNAEPGKRGTSINGTWTVTGVDGSTFTFGQAERNDSSRSAQGFDVDNHCTATCRADVFVIELNPHPSRQ